MLWVNEEKKIYIPEELQHSTLSWYHENLGHPGHNKMFNTMKQHLGWPGMGSQVEKMCQKCHICQISKNSLRQYGHLPESQPELSPWKTVAVDLVGPYVLKTRRKAVKRGRVTIQEKEELKLNCLTMIDMATRWFEIARIPDASSDTVAKIFDKVWFCRYPRPVKCIHDNGTEFMGESFQELLRSYGVKSRPTTVKNPQSNSSWKHVEDTTIKRKDLG